MTIGIAKTSPLAKLRQFWSARDEAGAGGLLPIITVGIIVIIVAATVASSTSFAAKISRTQVDQMSASIEASSLLNSFLSDVFKDTPLLPGVSIAGAGSYAVYYSAADEEPSTIADAGVAPLPVSGIPPTDTKWLIIEIEPESSEAQTAVFSFSPRGAAVLDNVVSWSGPVAISESTLGQDTGAQGAVSLSLRGSTDGENETLRIADSNLSTDVYASYEDEPVEIDSTAIRGSVSSQSALMFIDNPLILGSVYSGDLIQGAADVAGDQFPSELILPPGPEQNAAALNLPGDILSLNPADCSNAGDLKALIESIDIATTLTGAEQCAPESWTAEVAPKADLLIHSDFDLSVANFKVKGSEGTLGFSSNSNLQLNEVKYSAGAHGQFLSGGDLSVLDSELAGAISSYGNTATGGSLDITGSRLLYSPTSAPLLGDGGAPLSSNSIHLVRVS